MRVFEFLTSLGLEPVLWHQAVEATGKAAPFIGEIVVAGLGLVHAVTVLFTPDEVAYLRRELLDGDADPEGQPAMQSRPNVMFEAGMAMALLPDHTVLVEFGQVRLFTDLSGRHTIRLTNDLSSRHAFAHRLEVAGCPVDWDQDWRTAGDLTVPEPVGGGLPIGRREPPPAQPVRRTLAASLRAGSKSHRLDIHNRSSEAVFGVNLEVPDAAGGFVVGGQFPIVRIPPGETATVVAALAFGVPAHIEGVLTGHLADGTPVRDEVFINTRG